MIISKPKGNTLFALSMFLIICFGLLAYTLYNFLNNSNHFWYQYVIFVVISPIALAVTYKTIQSFKTIHIGKDKLLVHYPILFKKKRFIMKDLESWEETIIKTQGNFFKELMLKFSTDKVKLSNQENSEYAKVFNYLKKKFPNKKLK